jgi:prephenate dehydrogenase
MTKLFDRMVIAGVGLIGGSLGLAARARGLVGESVGYGRGEENLRTAERRGAVDHYSMTPAEAARGADLIVLAVPVRSLAAVAVELLPHARSEAVVIDVGSVKGSVVEALEAAVRPPASFVGCHPVAGTEHSGAANALVDLFERQLCILTPTAATDRTVLGRVRALWEGLGMRVETMPPDAHDRLLGLVSHLPHVVAYALIAAVEGDRVGGRDPLAYSGGGLRDTSRIASSHPAMWRDIFLDNRAEVLRAIDTFRVELDRLRELIETENPAELEATLARSRDARARLKDPRS